MPQKQLRKRVSHAKSGSAMPLGAVGEFMPGEIESRSGTRRTRSIGGRMPRQGRVTKPRKASSARVPRKSARTKKGPTRGRTVSKKGGRRRTRAS